MTERDISFIELELRKLGFNENEAKIYLACLELGKASVQNIAQSANLTRPTTYRILEKMERRGLVKRMKQKGNPFIIAQSPDELLGMLRVQKRRIEEQEREFIRIIALLKSEYYSGDKNEIKVFSGNGSRKIILDEFATTHCKKIFVVSSDAETKEMEDIYKKIRKRLGKIEVKEVNIIPKNSHADAENSKLDFLQKKNILNSNFPFSGLLIIYDKLIYLNKGHIYKVEEENIVELLRMFFSIIWKNN